MEPFETGATANLTGVISVNPTPRRYFQVESRRSQWVFLSPVDLEFPGSGVTVPRTTTFVALLLVLTCLTATNRGLSQERNGDRQHHSWARFGLGSWKRIRVLTETLDQDGVVDTTTTEETKTTLMQVDEDRYTIKAETSVEVAGKRIQGGPRYITRGYHGEVNGQKARIEKLGFGEVTICGQTYRSEIKRIVINGADTKLVSKVHYAADATPHVLRRETTGTAGKTNRFESLVEVVAVDRSSNVLGQTKLAAHVKTVNKLANGETTVTLEVQCEDIPGGVVSHTERTLDENGRVVQRRTLELLGYQTLGVQPIPHRVYRRHLRNRRRGFFAPRR